MQDYIGSLLADISYLDEIFFENGKLTEAGAKERSISEDARLFFNEHFTFVDQSNGNTSGSISGFCGSTIVCNKSIVIRNEMIMEQGTFSILYRGTEPNIDFITDFTMAIGAANELLNGLNYLIENMNVETITADDISIIINQINNFGNNSYLSLIGMQRENALNYFNALIDVNPTAKINVYGHSLGGYLANYVTIMGQNYNNIDKTITFNAPGFNYEQLSVIKILEKIETLRDAISSDVLKNELQEGLSKIIDFSEKIYNPASLDKLNSIYSITGPEFTTNDSLGMFHPELRIPLYTDDEGAISNHFVRYLRESLPIYESLNMIMGGSKLDNYNKLTELFDSYQNPTKNNEQKLTLFMNHIFNYLDIEKSFNNTFDILNYFSNLSQEDLNKLSYKELNSSNYSESPAHLYALFNLAPFILEKDYNVFKNPMYNIDNYTKQNIDDRYDLYQKYQNAKNIEVFKSSIPSMNIYEKYSIIYDNSGENSLYLIFDEYNKTIITNDFFSASNSFNFTGDDMDNIETTYFKSYQSTLIVNSRNNKIYDTYLDDYIILNKGETILDLSYGNDTINIDVSNGATLKDITIKDNGIGDLFIFNGGNNSDIIQGTQYNDKIIGSAGEDHLFGGDGDDIINGGIDNDMLFGGNGNDTLIGDDGNDYLMGGAGSNSLDGGAGDDTLNIYNTPTEYHDIRGDSLNGGTGFNKLFGTGYGDTYTYGGGVDTIYENDKHFGINYVDKLIFKSTTQASQVSLYNILNNLVIAINGLNKIFVIDYYNNNYSYLDEIHFTNIISGEPIIWDTNYILNHTINRTDGAFGNMISGTSNNDNISGTAQDDYIDAGDGDDTVNGGDGNDIIYGGSGNDTLNGNAGNDTIYGEDGNDIINGGVGVDKLYGGDGDDNISGGSLIATEVDVIEGGAGNDVINQFQSFTGDVVWGGTGNDIIYGSAGGDSYHYSLGDGHDTIIENNSTSTYIDQLYLHNISPDAVKIYRKSPSFTDVIIEINNGEGSIKILNYYQSTTTLNYLDKIIFDNGTQWSINEIKLQAKNYTGTDQADTLTLNNGLPNVINMGGGIDIITNDTADNVINAGSDDDKISTNGKNVTIHGDEGNDSIILNYKSGSTGSGTIYGDDGNDTISFYTSNTSTNYTIIGGLGDDKIYMSHGTEIIKYSLGDGHDIVYVAGGSTNTQRDKIVFENITLSMINNSILRLENRGKDVVFMFDKDNSITLVNYFSNTSTIHNIYTFEFADGSLTNIDLKNIMTNISKPDSTNVFYDTAWDDKITGTSGVDIINIVNGGTDEIFGEGGDDIITGNAANQIIHGGSGTDRINSGNGYDIIYGDDGDDFISSASEGTTSGAIQNDTITGGKGNDTIYLFAGSSTIHYQLGDGNDTILLGSNNANDIDRIVFGSGIMPDKVDVKLVNKKDVKLIFSDGGSILLNDYFLNRANLDKIDFFKFADGTEWTAQDIVARLGTIEGTNGQDVLYDTVWDDIINAYEGKDYIYTTSGADIINAGGGDDYVSLKNSNGAIVDAGTGNDEIFIDLGNKNTTVTGGSGNDNYWIDGSNTTLIMSSINNGIDYVWAPNYRGPVNIRINANMGDMILSDINDIDGTFYWSSDSAITISMMRIIRDHQYNFIFNDGQTQNITDIVNKVEGDNNDNTLSLYTAFKYITSIYGHGGNDTLISNADATYLDGGSGDDRLVSRYYYNLVMQGGSGNDTFEVVFGATIHDTSGYDKVNLSLSSGLSYNSIILTDIGNDFVVTNKADGKSITFSKNIEELILSGSSKTPIARLVGNEINQVIELMAQYESDDLASMANSEDPEIVKEYNAIRTQITKDISSLWAV